MKPKLNCVTALLTLMLANSSTLATTSFSKDQLEPLRAENLVAWCIVPFDRAKRGPVARAEMLQRLGLRKVAYDWREQHVPTFEQEIRAYQNHDLEFFAFWGVHDQAFELFAKYQLHPQIWITVRSPDEPTQVEKVNAAVKALLPLVKRTQEMGCRLGLYNHGGWGGEPENLVEVCQRLRAQYQAHHVGIVYNFHHAHDRVQDFQRAFSLIQPFLLCLNLNGMNDAAQPKILPIGQGQHEKRMIEIVLQSGYQGPIGIIDHREQLDAEISLRQNLNGLTRLIQSWRIPE